MPQTVAPAVSGTAAKGFPARMLGVIFSPARPTPTSPPGRLARRAAGGARADRGRDVRVPVDRGRQERACSISSCQTMESFGVTAERSGDAADGSRGPRGPRYFTADQPGGVRCRWRRSSSPASLLAVFNAMLGGEPRFKQVFAIVVYSGVILALQALFVLPLDYARETLSSPTNLGGVSAVPRREFVRGAAARVDRSVSSSGGSSAWRSVSASCTSSAPVRSRSRCSSSTRSIALVDRRRPDRRCQEPR